MFSGPVIPASEALDLLSRAVVLDARAGPDARSAYARAHVRGARYVDLEADLSQVGDPADGGRHPLPAFDRWLARVGAWGIDTSTPVLVYDASAGGMAAARLWWMLRAIGHTPVAVVDGGFGALQAVGVPIGRSAPSSQGGARYPSLRRRWPNASADLVERARNDSSWRVIDARAPERYAGEVEPIDPVAGHIPGAINLHWRSQVDDTGLFHRRTDLRRRYHALLGDVPADRVVCYCGSGVTACHLLLAMEACGLFGARLYVGSWSEWCRTRGDAIPPR